MSGLIVKALEQSPLLQSYTKNDPLDMSYGIQKSYPNVIPSLSYATPSSFPASGQAVHGKKMNFNITREGRWSNALLEMFGTLKNAGGTAFASNPSIGLELFSSITLTSASRVIWTQSDSYASGRTQSSSTQKAAEVYRISQFLSTVAATYGEPATPLVADTKFVTYVPIYLSFFEDPRNYISLKDMEPLVLNFTFNSAAAMGLPVNIEADNAVPGGDGYIAKLHLYTVDYDRETEDALTQANSAATKELQYFSYTSESLVIPVTATNTKPLIDGLYPIRVNIASLVPATNMYVHIRKVADMAANGSDIGRAVQIVKYDMKINSKPYLANIPKVVQSYGTVCKGGGGVVTSAIIPSNHKHLHLPWTEEVNNRVQLCGALPFVGLSSPELTLYVAVNPNAVANSHEVVIVLESATNLTMFGNNGVIEESSST